MGTFKKFVVCLTLLLTVAAGLTGLAAGLLVRPLPALAVWGDNNEPMPVLFGLELGSDAREHPELGPLDRAGLVFPEDWGKGASYGGIPVEPIGYSAFAHKIASIDFFIKTKDFPRFRKLMRREFGNEILRDDEGRTYSPNIGYYWGKYEMEIRADYPFNENVVRISFSYLPLDNQFFDSTDSGVPSSFTYQGVTLGRKAEDYPFLHPIREEIPDIVYYQSDEPPLVFVYSSAPRYVESETWVAYKGVIYSLELRGDKSDDHFMGTELAKIYKFGDYEASVVDSVQEFRMGAYTLYFKPGLTVTTYMPTYWAMLRAKTRLGK